MYKAGGALLHVQGVTPAMNHLDWISYTFDQTVSGLPKYTELESTNIEVLDHLSWLFTNTRQLSRHYSQSQMAQGLWFLFDPSCSSYIFAFLDDTVSKVQRKRALKSIFHLFCDYFAQECPPRLGHTEQASTPHPPDINQVCYMFWDIVPLHPQGSEDVPKSFDLICLDVMQQTLGLDHIACQESALHGLGHWHAAYPKTTSKIIKKFLLHTRPQKDLKIYAEAACQGAIQ